MSGLLLKGVSKRYFNGVNAVSNVNLELADGELVVLAGPMSSGKSTILKIICGLEKPDEGEVYIDSQSALAADAKERNVAIVFPCHELYPNNTVHENLQFSLRLMKCPRALMEAKIKKVSEDMGLTDVLDKLPEELTQEEYFAAILARCVIKDPKVILIDEPFGDMPLEYQQSFWKAVLDLNDKFKITILLATNNPEEAFSLDVRTVILRNGYIQQIDNVANLQEKPANLYVAQFVNDMNMTTLEGVLEQGDDSTVKLIIDKGAIKVDISAAEDNKRLKNYIGRDVTAGIRHDFLKIAKNDELGIKGKIEQVSADADKNTALFKSKLFDAWICVGADVKEGDKISLEVNENAVFVFDRDTGKTII